MQSAGFRYGATGAVGPDPSLAGRFRRHAESLIRNRRSPLSARVMLEAADDIDAGGVVRELFEGVPVPSGSVPQLRLLGALHYLVLSGRAPALALLYPSVGGVANVDAVWPVARETLRENSDAIKERLGRTVQTNEPGRSTVLFPALLWLTDRYRLPIRLLEIGASAGLNLLADRYGYVIDGQVLGNPCSPVRFEEPWVTPPGIDLVAAAAQLRMADRAGCDLAPRDPTDPEDRLTLLSYIWPDELDRFNRVGTALALSAGTPTHVVKQSAGTWLAQALARGAPGELTVVWHSLFRQYLPAGEWDELQAAFRHAADVQPRRLVAWLSMEPSEDHTANIELTVRTHPDEPAAHLAWCGDHGPPVTWERGQQHANGLTVSVPCFIDGAGSGPRY